MQDHRNGIGAAILIAASGLVASGFAACDVGAASGEPGAAALVRVAPAAPSDRDALKAALDAALDDERHAFAMYRAVMTRHGQRPPFSNIIKAEGRHEGALLRQYERLGFRPPANAWASRTLEVPATFAESCDAAVVAEVRNAEIYERIERTVSDPEVLRVFESLRRASIERHLPAFRRQGSGWAPVTEAALTDAQRTQRATADAARTAMFGRLMAELTAAMKDGGPGPAIDVCADRAPVIAAEVAREHGVRIGRTSFRQRNPANTPPIWADLLLDARPETPQLLADRAGRLGVVQPIHVAPNCLACHGAPGDLAPDVAERLAARYPQDAAVGFAAGDLRGWFWVEVPATAGSAPANAEQPGRGRGRGAGQGRGGGRGGRGGGNGNGAGAGAGTGGGPAYD